MHETTLDLAPGAGTARAAQPLLVLHLAGTQQQMGRQHGTLVREAGGYEPVLEYYPRMPWIMLGGAELERGLGRAASKAVGRLLERLLRRLERDRPALYRRRSEAFFEALGQPAGQSRYLLVMDLLQNLVGVAGRFGLGPSRDVAARAAIPACSSLAVWGRASAGGTLRHARNFDFPGSGIWERQQTVVFCAPDQGLRYGFVTTRGADAPGVTAFNEAGLSLSVHTCFHRDVRFRGAGIVDVGHELIRRAETLEDAVRIARERPVASSWSLLVSSARERSAVVLEIGARRVETRRPAPDEDWLGQTNRYRVEALRPREVAPSPGFIANSEGRYQTLRRHAEHGSASGGMDLADLQGLLGSHEDPDVEGAERAAGGVPGQGYSVKSVVVEPEAGRLHVSVGPCPTGLGPYVAVDWSWDGPVGAKLVQAEGSTPPAAGASRYAAGPGARGLEAYVEAVALQGQGRPTEQVASAVERAAAADPEEPVYRLLAGAHRLRQDDIEGALVHFRAGLQSERSPYYRGLLLLWASRGADALGRSEEARRWREELLGLGEPLLLDLQAKARREARRPFPRRRFRRLAVHGSLPDIV
jgi:acyl-CoA:6-aminopenicillanic acid acyl transferase